MKKSNLIIGSIIFVVLAVLIVVSCARAEISLSGVGKTLISQIEGVEVSPAYSLIENRLELLISKDLKTWKGFNLLGGVITDNIRTIDDVSDLVKSMKGIGTGVSYELTNGEKLGLSNPILKNIKIEPLVFVALKRFENLDIIDSDSRPEFDMYVGIKSSVKW